MAGAAIWAALAGLTGQLTNLVMVSVLLVVALLADLLLRIAEVGHSHKTANGRQAAWLVHHWSLQAIWKGSLALAAFAGMAMLAVLVGVLMWLTGVAVMAVDGSESYFSNAASDRLDTMIATIMASAPLVTTLAAVLALVSLFLYESAIIKAGQDVPNA